MYNTFHIGDGHILWVIYNYLPYYKWSKFEENLKYQYNINTLLK